MKQFIRTALLIATVSVLLLSGCVKQDGFEQKQVVEGEGARVKLSFISPESGRVSSRAALDDADEPKINNLQVIIVNKLGAVVTNQNFSNPPTPVSVETFSGNNMKIYVFANAVGRNDINLQNELTAVKSETALKAIIQNLSTDNAIAREMLLATGIAPAVNIQPGNTNAIPTIKLYYVSSRIDFIVKDGTPTGDKFEAIFWDVVNVPIKSYVIGTTTDAVDNSKTDDFHYTAGSFSFDDVATSKQWKSSFYTFENRQGGRVPNAGTPPEGYTPGDIGSASDKDKAWYAPAKATYILINGMYTKNGKTSVQNMKIYLGRDNHSNYDVERGKRYTVTITVKGRNEVKIDSNIEDINSDHEVQKSANLNMDAHPDMRVFRIAGSAKNGLRSLATIEILDVNNRIYSDAGFNAKWLKVSPLNLYRHQVNQGAGGLMQQQQSATDAFFVRPKYIPHKSWRAANSGKNWGWNAVMGSDTDDDELTFDKATYRMCYKITDIPFENPAVVTFQEIHLYSDEYIGTSSRSAKVKITYDDGAGFVDTEIFTVSQQGAIVGTNLSIENTEESGLMIAPGQPSTLQNISTMQWGHTSTLLNTDDVRRYSFGAYNTAFTTYDTTINGLGTNSPSWTNDTYRTPMWPYAGAAITSYSGGNSGAPYYNPTIGIDAIHPIYNSSAARYCHEKNRDLNGDGIIAQSETFWYLPSFADLWGTRASLASISESLWTSSEENATSAWVFNPSNNAANPEAKTAANRVRCVRGLGASLLGQATIASRESDKTKINFRITGGGAEFDVFDPNGAGLRWTVVSSEPAWLTVNTSNAPGTSSIAETGTVPLYAYATTNTEGERTATLTLTRPGQPSAPARQITVTQAEQPGGYDDVLYFAPNGKLQCGKWANQSRDTPPYTYHRSSMAFFKFGSVVGFTQYQDDAWGGTSIKFNPVKSGGVYADYAQVPQYDNEVPAAIGEEGWISNVWHTGERVLQGKGDPCKLVGLTAAEVKSMSASQIDAYKSGWRLPTSTEQADFCGLSGAGNISYDQSIFPSYADYLGYPSTKDGNPFYQGRAYFPIAGGTTVSQNTGRTFNSSGNFLVAGGHRFETGGKGVATGIYGFYWSGTIYSSTNGYMLYFSRSSTAPRSGNLFSCGKAVRCVRQK